jgi:IS5 family transposase
MMRSGTLVDATAANVHAVTAAAGLLRKDDGVVYRDSACLGIEKRDGIRNSPPLSAITYRINRRPGRFPQGFRQRH